MENTKEDRQSLLTYLLTVLELSPLEFKYKVEEQDDETIKNSYMSTYDMMKAEGHAEGWAKSKEIDYGLFKEEKINSVKKMLDVGIEAEVVANVLDVTKDFVLAIKNNESPDDRFLRDRFFQVPSSDAA